MNSLKKGWHALISALDSDHFSDPIEVVRAQPERIDPARCVSFAVLHLGCLGIIWVGVGAWAVWTAVALYFIRMFFVTGIYHRYFSHKTYSTSRFVQFLMALAGTTCVQRGPLWWAYVHRHHHRHSDEPPDMHSPVQHGFWWSHIGWITSNKNHPTDYTKIKDLAKYPELRLLNRYDLLGSVLLLSLLAIWGAVLRSYGVDTSPMQMIVWGYFVSTTFLFHGTACINSMAHVFGSRRYDTKDDSRNSFLLALITLGEGWHNNHHRYMSATRQGFYWWEIDITYYLLKAISWTGLIWDLKGVPKSAYENQEVPADEADLEDPEAAVIAAAAAAKSGASVGA
ncbi:MAG: acyl-CoA desaturase [Verrucomicrobia bacterium]|nr:acyl-CoA desaturase [Verrucomicrobiota bacterium]